MHHPALSSSNLGFLPAMNSFSSPTTSLPEFDLGSPSTAENLTNNNNSWETRRLRKHRRLDDEGCSAKKRRLMPEAELDLSENSCPALSAQQPDAESSCMDIESAQRRLQEIEDRITLEDDDDDEDLDVEPAARRPVLVISDSLKEGLQCGISDILPQTVAQSVYGILIQLSFPSNLCPCMNIQKRKSLVKEERETRTLRESLCLGFCCGRDKKLLFSTNSEPTFYLNFQESLRHGVGVVASSRRSFLSATEGLVTETA
ncbi:coiled-coil domain-containing protein 117 isoform X2 [Austrofundulus limnaeus]|uniref:Coiled-coil domain-containing protein 117 isoform X2 n=1 Tax=Austrofundulus limnaeus TaxID=52670 RepID=A0A2I4BPX2_AUSLI|nr:PREDICTED: coiled-coil domain-containing protein 117 isoform X2 [Austrofundulus limnaeus]